jgi:hypothetical protein
VFAAGKPFQPSVILLQLIVPIRKSQRKLSVVNADPCLNIAGKILEALTYL